MPAAKSDIHELLAAASGGEPSCRLPRGTSMVDVAEECRRVALVLLESSLLTMHALEAWLEGPYRSLVAVDYLLRPANWLAGRASKIAV